MATNLYIGVNNVARKIKNMYIGVGGKARKIKKGYIGIGNKARLFYVAKPQASGYTTTTGCYASSAAPIGKYIVLLSANPANICAPYSKNMTRGEELDIPAIWNNINFKGYGITTEFNSDTEVCTVTFINSNLVLGTSFDVQCSSYSGNNIGSGGISEDYIALFRTRYDNDVVVYDINGVQRADLDSEAFTSIGICKYANDMVCMGGSTPRSGDDSYSDDIQLLKNSTLTFSTLSQITTFEGSGWESNSLWGIEATSLENHILGSGGRQGYSNVSKGGLSDYLIVLNSSYVQTDAIQMRTNKLYHGAVSLNNIAYIGYGYYAIQPYGSMYIGDAIYDMYNDNLIHDQGEFSSNVTKYNMGFASNQGEEFILFGNSSKCDSYREGTQVDFIS